MQLPHTALDSWAANLPLGRDASRDQVVAPGRRVSTEESTFSPFGPLTPPTTTNACGLQRLFDQYSEI